MRSRATPTRGCRQAREAARPGGDSPGRQPQPRREEGDSPKGTQRRRGRMPTRRGPARGTGGARHVHRVHQAPQDPTGGVGGHPPQGWVGHVVWVGYLTYQHDHAPLCQEGRGSKRPSEWSCTLVHAKGTTTGMCAHAHSTRDRRDGTAGTPRQGCGDSHPCGRTRAHSATGTRTRCRRQDKRRRHTGRQPPGTEGTPRKGCGIAARWAHTRTQRRRHAHALPQARQPARAAPQAHGATAPSA
jgi:hypothetical protein